MPSQCPSGETPLMPELVGAHRAPSGSLSPGARICEPSELVITSELETRLRVVSPSEVRSGNRANAGGAAAFVAGVTRQRKHAGALSFRLPNNSCPSGVKQRSTL